MNKVRCNVCGKSYEMKPEKCEFDGLDDFYEIIEDEALTVIILGDGKNFKEYSVIEFPVDLCQIDPEQKFNFPFSPKGQAFQIKLPLKVIFSGDGVFIKKAEKENTFALTLSKTVIKCELKIKKDGSGVFQKIDMDMAAESETIQIDLYPNDEIYLNGLTFKLLKK